MSKFTRVLSFVLALVMVMGLAACDGGKDSTGTTGTTGPSGSTENAKKTYTVTVKTNGGMAMAGFNVYVYNDSALTDMKAAAATDEKGQATFEMVEGEYYVQLQGIPAGYDVQPYYTFNGTSANITLTSGLVTDETVENHVFKVGDVMYDFTFADQSRILCKACGEYNDTAETLVNTAEDGTEVKSYISRLDCAFCGEELDWKNPEFPSVTLADVLGEKDLVVLNFWYTTCGNCVDEFPILNEAYRMFGEDVAVLGLNSYGPDTYTGVMTFESSYSLELDFPLGKVSNTFCPSNFINPLTGEGAAGYPTSVFVDRYGVICAIEVGAMTSLTQWVSVFSHFVGDDYQQKTVASLEELIERVLPTEPFPTDEEIAAAIQDGEFNVDYYGDEDDTYSWPFVVTEKDGRTCLKASNQMIYESYAILYASIELEAGDVVAFDYLASCEKGGDYLHVIVDGEAIYSIGEVGTEWKSAYCWVADKAGTYEVALCYIKDSSGDEGDDTVYIDNLRVVTVADIDTPSYIPGQAAVEQADGSYEYITYVYNEQDGYYHVGTADGPLLLANLMGYTQMIEDDFVWNVVLESGFVLDGVDYEEAITPYCTAANNSALTGYCTVTPALAELLIKFTELYGFSGEADEWLKLCKYYTAYGTDGEQLSDPIAGLTWYSAFEAVLGEGYVDENGEGQNFFFYDGRLILPRGLWARFVPEKSGVYRITTTYNDYAGELSGWIFDRDHNTLMEYDGGEMLQFMYAEDNNITFVFYMEAGKDYYIDIAPFVNEAYMVGYVIYDVEYVGETYQLFTSCSPGPHTYEEGSGQTIIRGIDVAIADDGYYHEVLERDEDGNPVRFGSIVYAYFTGSTVCFPSQPIYPLMIDLHAFDFSKTDNDLEILAYMDLNDGDVEATDAYLRELWGSDYEQNMEEYKVEDVFAGIYHGEGEDYTEEIMGYVAKIIQGSNTYELTGCVPVDARLAELLTMLMDKYVFADVDYSWQKLCYYYRYLGPEA